MSQLAELQAPVVSSEPTAAQLEAQRGDWQAKLFLHTVIVWYFSLTGSLASGSVVYEAKM